VRFFRTGSPDSRSRRGRLRNGIKTYSNWPTIPQLYVKGEFVGGCDIIREMFQAGELQQLLADKGVTVNAAATA
jgi:monothiol glutaredoxin